MRFMLIYKVMLGPVLLAQGRRARRTALRLAEAAGERSGLVVVESAEPEAPNHFLRCLTIGSKMKLLARQRMDLWFSAIEWRDYESYVFGTLQQLIPGPLFGTMCRFVASCPGDHARLMSLLNATSAASRLG